MISNDLQRTFFRTLNRAVAPVVKLGVGSPLPIGVGAVVVEHTGRLSGNSYEVPLLGLRLGKQVFVSSVREQSQWVRNLEADDATGVWLCGRRRAATAEVTRGPLNVVGLTLD